MLAAQLEFVQILVIVVVMTVMVVVITCLLNHYRLSARSLLSRHAPTRRRHLPLANVSQAPRLHLDFLTLVSRLKPDVIYQHNCCMTTSELFLILFK